MTEPSPVDGLDAAVAEEICNGGRLKSRTPGDAVIVYGSGNVLMRLTFACLTLITSGFFVFAWIVWANTNREHRVTLRVDSDGTILRNQLARTPSTPAP
jgi:hypothetical protein